jgi:restriction system protein
LGYSVQATPVSGDWGADLILTRDGERTVVQAKRYTKSVGLEAVQEAVTARAKYHCSRSIVVTNSTFTRQARELAFANGTELWDREKLTKELGRLIR